MNATLLEGRYALVRPLGGGARGVAYEAENLLMGNRVVLKLIEKGRAQALQQARECSKLDHPNLVRVLAVSQQDSPAFVVSERIAGVALGALAVGSEDAWPTAVDIGLQVLSALQHLHERGLTHGALHPANVLIRYPRPGVPWVVLTDGLGPTKERLEWPGAATPFISPQVLAGAPAGPSDDLYGAGALLRLLTDLLRSSRQVPPRLESLTARAIGDSPTSRFGSAGEFADALSALLQPGSQPIAPWSQAPEITYQQLAQAHSSSAGPPTAAERSAPSVRAVGRDSHVTDSLLMNPRFNPPGPASSQVDKRNPWPSRLLGIALVLTFLVLAAWALR